MLKTETTLACIERIDALSALIGNTPLLQIEYRIDGQLQRIFAKYEAENMTGSIKDRMALFVIRKAYEKGMLQPGDTIVEASSGNTGISFAALGNALGHPVRIYIPSWMSQERIRLIQAFGADVQLIGVEQGGFVGAVKSAEAYANSNSNSFLPRQFQNPDNVAAHELGTAPEIERQLQQFNRQADAFVAGVGTGGSVMGIGRYLKRRNALVKVHPLEPANSPTLRTGYCAGHHRIQGISDEFVPAICQLQELDEIVDCWDGDAILMAQRLCRELGLAVGISSGANVLGAMMIAKSLGDQATVVTLLPDSNKKYLSTDLCGREPARSHYWTPRVKLIQMSATR